MDRNRRNRPGIHQESRNGPGIHKEWWGSVKLWITARRWKRGARRPVEGDTSQVSTPLPL
jgi:hypothetical protein